MEFITINCLNCNIHYSAGRLTSKSDVYSFGVVLLELLSGRRAEDNLVDWARPYLGDKRRLFRIMDTKLEGRYPQKGAYVAANLASQCLGSEPRARPRMAEILGALEELESSKTTTRISQPVQRAIPALSSSKADASLSISHQPSPRRR